MNLTNDLKMKQLGTSKISPYIFNKKKFFLAIDIFLINCIPMKTLTDLCWQALGGRWGAEAHSAAVAVVASCSPAAAAGG